ncbi:hypothetical protein DEO72_LG7g643 [Vigna unguiculata]|uniref:Uncharacterized protein n=1 Tax=Vigna unguiculata TaxID=3917 RepID=A0A4D6MD48_VIGUN|nr:hypothetical protein DEO72_LG7g643 [Vigna unguiculata]
MGGGASTKDSLVMGWCVKRLNWCNNTDGAEIQCSNSGPTELGVEQSIVEAVGLVGSDKKLRPNSFVKYDSKRMRTTMFTKSKKGFHTRVNKEY